MNCVCYFCMCNVVVWEITKGQCWGWNGIKQSGNCVAFESTIFKYMNVSIVIQSFSQQCRGGHWEFLKVNFVMRRSEEVKSEYRINNLLHIMFVASATSILSWTCLSCLLSTVWSTNIYKPSNTRHYVSPISFCK